MYKKLLYLFLIVVMTVTFTGCHRPKTIILFNQEPITNENFLNNSTQFKVGKRIYYLFITEKPLQAEMIRVRIFKRDEKGGMDISKIAYSNDFKLSKEHQIFYYNDYVVIHDAGYYCMAVYLLTALNRPLASADFQVK